MVKIGILDIHQGYDEVEWFVTTFDYGKIRENVRENYNEININSIEELMVNINNYLKPNETTVLNITDLYYNDKYVIQAIYSICDNDKSPTFNKLASQLTKNINVSSNMILFKRDITDQHHRYLNFTFDDLADIIKDTFIHNGLIIKPDKTIIDYQYINDILEGRVEEYTFKNIRYYEYKYIDYTITFYCDISAERTENNLNVIASTIYGEQIYGEVYLTLTTTREDYLQNLNFTREFLNKLFMIHATGNKDFDLQKYAVKPIETTNDINNYGFPAITYSPNLFKVVSDEYDIIKNKDIIINPFNFKKILNDIV